MIKTPSHLAPSDLEHVLAHTAPLWENLRGQRLFITGGTGFFGRWLLETFLQANDAMSLGATAVVLSRDPSSLVSVAPHLAHAPALSFHVGDVRTFAFPPGPFSHVIHGASETRASVNARDPLGTIDTIVGGTRRTLELAREKGVSTFLLLSSGAVYGRQPLDVDRVAEDHVGGPDPANPRSAYAEAKRMAELLCAIHGEECGLSPIIARCFAFVGPHLPLGEHFAIGNFIRDGLCGNPIQVQGDGTPLRSYLYAADLAIWLWTLLLKGPPGRIYNVGSDQALSVGSLASRIGAFFSLPVHIARPPQAGAVPERYVPAIGRASSELGLAPFIPLDEAIERTVRWHDASRPS